MDTAAEQIDVTGVTLDHRHVVPGVAFACMRGAHFDGHAFAAHAAAAGAPLIIAEEPVVAPAPVLTVESVQRAIGPIAAALAGDPSSAMRCFGVTGTNGKTTTTFLLDSIAQAGGARSALIGTTGVRIGADTIPTGFTTPQAPELQGLLARCRASQVDRVAMEVSSHALDQHRVDGTRFAVVGFTNLTRDHLDYHGDEDSYFEAKARLFDLKFAPIAAINVDDPRGAVLAARAVERGLEVWGVGRNAGEVPGLAHYVQVADLTCSALGFVAHLLVDAAPVELHSTLLGAFNVENALLALSMSLASGDPLQTALAGLRAPNLVPGRMQGIPARDRVAIVDYAHTPDALERVLQTARTLGERVVLVFGCGGDRDRGKRALMGTVAAHGADVIIVTNDNPRSEDPQAIAKEILTGIGAAPVMVELDRATAITAAVEQSRPGDVIVVAGKGHETTQTIGETVAEFDDAAVLAHAIESAGIAP